MEEPGLSKTQSSREQCVVVALVYPTVKQSHTLSGIPGRNSVAQVFVQVLP